MCLAILSKTWTGKNCTHGSHRKQSIQTLSGRVLCTSNENEEDESDVMTVKKVIMKQFLILT